MRKFSNGFKLFNLTLHNWLILMRSKEKTWSQLIFEVSINTASYYQNKFSS